MEGVIAVKLATVQERIAAAARAADRATESVTLVAVSKTHPAASVRQALMAGHRVFGENRVQEAQAKYPALRESFPDLALHQPAEAGRHHPLMRTGAFAFLYVIVSDEIVLTKSR